MIKDQLEVAYGECSETHLDELMDELTTLDDDIKKFIKGKQGVLE